MDDEKRRASDALLAAIEVGFSLLEIVELAMDDATAPEWVVEKLSEEHDKVRCSRCL